MIPSEASPFPITPRADSDLDKHLALRRPPDPELIKQIKQLSVINPRHDKSMK